MSSEVQLIMVSGGVFLIAVILPYVGYKLWQRFYPKCAENPCCGSSVRTNRQGRASASAASVLRGFLSRRVLPKLIIDFSEGSRVGETVSFRITLPPPSQHSTFRVRPTTSSGNASQTPTVEELAIIHRQNLDQLFIDVTKVVSSDGFLFEAEVPRAIPVVKELLPAQGNEKEDVLLVSFFVRESGLYVIKVLYDEEHLKGSPFHAPFNAAILDPEKTICVQEAPTLVAIASEPLCIRIRPKDRFENECNFRDVDTDQFTFQLVQVDETLKGVLVEQLIYSCERDYSNDWDQFLTRYFEVKLTVEIFQPGVFKGIITYGNSKIQNGTIEIVVMSPGEQDIFRNILRDNPATRYHECKLVAMGDDIARKPQDVYVYLSPRLLSIKEFYCFGLIPCRIANFRIIPATKMQFILNSVDAAISKFSIVDRTQPKIILETDTTTCRVILAMFAHFIKQRLGGSESFENKRKFFFDELRISRENNVRTTTTCITVQRHTFVQSSLSETKSFTGREWCRNFKIKYSGEEGADDGGLRREWLDVLCLQMFENNPTGMFCSMGNSRLVHPNPNRESSKWTLKHYEFAGKIVGKCLFETAFGGHFKQMVNGRFSRSFLAQIIGFTPHYRHFEQDDPEFFLGKVKYILENDVEAMELTFTEEEYSTNGQLLKVAELVQDGSKMTVTNENKQLYLNSLAVYRLGTRVKREMEAFQKGLSEIVPDGLLTNFDENEFEILMCGKSEFNIADLQAHYAQTDETIESRKILSWFWSAVSNLTDEEKTRLLQFTTGSSLLPYGGFKELVPKFRITVTNTVGRLPIAHTCFNEICLSVHNTYEEFEKSLRTAINEGSHEFCLL